MCQGMCEKLQFFTNEELEQLEVALRIEMKEREIRLQNTAMEELATVLDKYKELGVLFFVEDSSTRYPIYFDECVIHTGILKKTEERTK